MSALRSLTGEAVVSHMDKLTAVLKLRPMQSIAIVDFTIVSTQRTLDHESNGWKDGEELRHRPSMLSSLRLVDETTARDRHGYCPSPLRSQISDLAGLNDQV